jgi:hypothetical protein
MRQTIASWRDVVADAPDFAGNVQRIFDSRRHKTLATIRRDGSPRVSGIELTFTASEVLMGVMPGSVKLLDLRRDPRLAVHGVSDDPPAVDPSQWAGDVKITGRVVAVPSALSAATPSNTFRIELSEVIWTRVGTPADHLVIESWHPGKGHQRRIRR